jgi:hypothetical protein
MGRDRREGRLETPEPMSEPLRFKPVNPAHEMVYSADGGWVAWEDYARLKAEVERLTPLLGDIVSFDEYHKLLQQVERLTKAGDAFVLLLEDEGYDMESIREVDDWNAAKEGKPHA